MKSFQKNTFLFKRSVLFEQTLLEYERFLYEYVKKDS